MVHNVQIHTIYYALLATLNGSSHTLSTSACHWWRNRKILATAIRKPGFYGHRIAECCTHTDFLVIVKITDENHKRQWRYNHLNNVYDNFPEIKSMCFARQNPCPMNALSVTDKICGASTFSFTSAYQYNQTWHGPQIGTDRCLVHFLVLSRDASVYQCGKQVRNDW